MSRFVLFMLLLYGLLALLNFRAYRWLSYALKLEQRARRVLAWVLGVSLVASGMSRVLHRMDLDVMPEALTVLAFGIQLTVIISVVLLLGLDLVRLLAVVVRRVSRLATSKPPLTETAVVAEPALESDAGGEPEAPPPSPVLTRREFATQAVVTSTFCIGGGSALYGSLWGRHDYVVEEVPIAIPGLSRALDGFSIVQLSDLHIGQFVGESELAAAVDLVRQAKPDLIVLTGDLIDNDARLAPTLGRFVRQLDGLAREGVAAISGNHDYYAGIDPIVDTLRAGGARVLRNQGVVLGDAGAGVALLGVDDVRASRFQPAGGPNLQRALQSLPSLGGRVAPALDLPRVLLCHNPVYFEEAQGQVALQLSGHTHGGQVNLLVRPADWVLRHGWVAGLYREQESQLYVNRGFGTVGPPARVQAPPELSRVVLTRA